MICPRCSHEWAGSQGLCPRCGFNVRVSTPLEAMSPDPFQQYIPQAGDFFSALRQDQPQVQQSSLARNPRPQTDSFARKSSSETGATGARSSSDDLSGQEAARPLPGTRPFSGSLGKGDPLPGTRSMSGGLAGTSQGTGPTTGNTRGSTSLSGDLTASGPGGRAASETRPTFNDVSAPDLARPTRSASAPIGSPRSDSSASEQHTPASASRPLLPGVLLRDGRYRLQDLLERQDWLPGVFEATWIGRDTRRGGAPVTICEVVVPDFASLVKQTNLPNATRALAASGRDPHIATLLEAFSEQGRSFFVFELIEGDSLLTHLRRLGRPMAEAEVVELCWQLCEALDMLNRQSPPVTHGLIRPEHVYLLRANLQFVLATFSPLVVIGGAQFTSGVDRAHLSPYSPPEFPGERFNVRSDLYSLLATAYHAITGNVPAPANMIIPRAKQLNSAISPRLDAILSKGLHPVSQQRYQSPFELRQDLLALRTVGEQPQRARSAPAPSQRQLVSTEPPTFRETASAFPLPLQIAPLAGEPLQKSGRALLEDKDLPPLSERRNYLAYVETAILVGSLIAVAVLSNYHS